VLQLVNRWIHKSVPGEIAAARKRAVAVVYEKNDSEKWTIKMNILKSFFISLLFLLHRD